MPQPAALTRTDEPSIHDVIDLAGARDRATTKLVFSQRAKCWWSRTGSNRRPEACKATALPTELWPREVTDAIESKDTFDDWWAWEDLNLRPHAYQARALTN